MPLGGAELHVGQIPIDYEIRLIVSNINTQIPS